MTNQKTKKQQKQSASQWSIIWTFDLSSENDLYVFENLQLLILIQINRQMKLMKKTRKRWNYSMDKETEQFHKADCCLDFVSIMLINPDDCISLAHDYFPNDFFSDIRGVKEPVIRNSRGVMLLLKLDKIASTHPKVINMPSFENISKILSEKQPLKTSLTVNNINPQTSMKISHCFKSFPKRLTLMNLNIILQRGWFE